MIQNDIKGQISSGELVPGDRVSSEQELMSQYSVSRITVSNALRKMAEDKWIHRIPGKGSFVNTDIDPLISAFKMSESALAQRYSPLGSGFYKKTTVGIVVPFISDHYTENYINGILNKLDSNEYSVIIKVAQNAKNEAYSIDELLGLNVDGMIIFPYDRANYNDALLKMKLNNFPFVLIDRHLPGVDTNYVTSNNYEGGRLAARHLIDLGHRNICMCTGLVKPIRTPTVEDRTEGYQYELMESGIAINPDLLISELELDYNNFEKFEANRKLISLVKNKEISSIISLSTGYTLYIYTMLKSLGVNIPEDISIVSFDNPMPNSRDLEFFTYIDQSEFEQGQKAASIMKDLIKKKDLDGYVYYKEVVTPKLVVKTSTTQKV